MKKLKQGNAEKQDDERWIQADDYDVIGIDEGQFFPDIMWAETMANKGKVSQRPFFACDRLLK